MTDKTDSEKLLDFDRTCKAILVKELEEDLF
jgi:hypothetical protein